MGMPMYHQPMYSLTDIAKGGPVQKRHLSETNLTELRGEIPRVPLDELVQNPMGVIAQAQGIRKTGIKATSDRKVTVDYDALVLSVKEDMDAGRYSKVITILNPYANRVDNRNANFFNELGFAYKKLGDFDTALILFDRAKDEDPNLWAPYDNIAFIQVKRGNYKSALRNYKIAKTLNLSNDYKEKVSRWIGILENLINSKKH